ncbi:hypothetical protein E2C01_093791 [Portunus trituberculatus]|uniref:Uncharacterized protein n=1 Tax=Portunus trituberculatus TaxID=210409 RepID=A0A5B7JNN1_PORTR|nr:hypothetical protein [Portunus trituberculatus]
MYEGKPEDNHDDDNEEEYEVNAEEEGKEKENKHCNKKQILIPLTLLREPCLTKGGITLACDTRTMVLGAKTGTLSHTSWQPRPNLIRTSQNKPCRLYLNLCFVLELHLHFLLLMKSN